MFRVNVNFLSYLKELFHIFGKHCSDLKKLFQILNAKYFMGQLLIAVNYWFECISVAR